MVVKNDQSLMRREMQPQLWWKENEEPAAPGWLLISGSHHKLDVLIFGFDGLCVAIPMQVPTSLSDGTCSNCISKH